MPDPTCHACGVPWSKHLCREVKRLREIITRAVQECEAQEQRGDRDYGHSHDPQAIRDILEQAKGTP